MTLWTTYRRDTLKALLQYVKFAEGSSLLYSIFLDLQVYYVFTGPQLNRVSIAGSSTDSYKAQNAFHWYTVSVKRNCTLKILTVKITVIFIFKLFHFQFLKLKQKKYKEFRAIFEQFTRLCIVYVVLNTLVCLWTLNAMLYCVFRIKNVFSWHSLNLTARIQYNF